VFLCSWHVLRAWLKNLKKHVKDTHFRPMLDELTAIMESADKDSARAAVTAFMDKWVRLGLMAPTPPPPLHFSTDPSQGFGCTGNARSSANAQPRPVPCSARRRQLSASIGRSIGRARIRWSCG
jgi:hypothetical protein